MIFENKINTEFNFHGKLLKLLQVGECIATEYGACDMCEGIAINNKSISKANGKKKRKKNNSDDYDDDHDNNDNDDEAIGIAEYINSIYIEPKLH